MNQPDNSEDQPACLLKNARKIGGFLLLVALLLFGGKKIPELAKGLGEGIRNFKSSLKEEEHPAPDDKKPV